MVKPTKTHFLFSPCVSLVLLVFMNIARILATTSSPKNFCDMNSCSALNKARELSQFEPSRRLKRGGEFEGLDFWEEHETLFAQAWSELPHLHPELYTYDEDFQNRFINPKLKNAVEHIRALATSSANFDAIDESMIHELLKESKDVKDVFHIGQEDENSFGLFTKDFCQLMVEELEHLSNSGIPMRRPNGMNRYGAILDQVGLKPSMDGVVRDYIRPLAEMLYPEHISGKDAEEHYTFIVDYQKDPNDISDEHDFDIDLKEHRDSSVATLNACLGYENFTGGDVLFRADDAGGFGQNSKGTGNIVMRPGLAVLHKGQHRHAALPIKGGRRVNLIVWLMGKGGYVRIQPYLPQEQLTAYDRWSRI